MSRRMKSRQICPEKKHQKKQNFFPVNQGCLFPGKRIRDSVLTFDSIQNTAQTTNNRDDNGWMFSKVLAVAVCGYVQWLLACLKITPLDRKSVV